jgi:hypothetical protein
MPPVFFLVPTLSVTKWSEPCNHRDTKEHRGKNLSAVAQSRDDLIAKAAEQITTRPHCPNGSKSSQS